jgi:hypothetical protein
MASKKPAARKNSPAPKRKSSGSSPSTSSSDASSPLSPLSPLYDTPSSPPASYDPSPSYDSGAGDFSGGSGSAGDF